MRERLALHAYRPTMLAPYREARLLFDGPPESPSARAIRERVEASVKAMEERGERVGALGKRNGLQDVLDRKTPDTAVTVLADSQKVLRDNFTGRGEAIFATYFRAKPTLSGKRMMDSDIRRYAEGLRSYMMETEAETKTMTGSAIEFGASVADGPVVIAGGDMALRDKIADCSAQVSERPYLAPLVGAMEDFLAALDAKEFVLTNPKAIEKVLKTKWARFHPDEVLEMAKRAAAEDPSIIRLLQNYSQYFQPDFKKDSDGNMLDRDGNVTEDQSEAVARSVHDQYGEVIIAAVQAGHGDALKYASLNWKKTSPQSYRDVCAEAANFDASALDIAISEYATFWKGHESDYKKLVTNAIDFSPVKFFQSGWNIGKTIAATRDVFSGLKLQTQIAIIGETSSAERLLLLHSAHEGGLKELLSDAGTESPLLLNIGKQPELLRFLRAAQPDTFATIVTAIRGSANPDVRKIVDTLNALESDSADGSMVEGALKNPSFAATEGLFDWSNDAVLNKYFLSQNDKVQKGLLRVAEFRQSLAKEVYRTPDYMKYIKNDPDAVATAFVLIEGNLGVAKIEADGARVGARPEKIRILEQLRANAFEAAGLLGEPDRVNMIETLAGGNKATEKNRIMSVVNLALVFPQIWAKFDEGDFYVYAYNDPDAAGLLTPAELSTLTKQFIEFGTAEALSGAVKKDGIRDAMDGELNALPGPEKNRLLGILLRKIK